MINKHIKKTDAELIFTKDRVYKIFSTDIVTEEVIDDLFRLDKLANKKPLFIAKTTIEQSPFADSNVKGNPSVIVIRLLNDVNALSTLAINGKLTEIQITSLAKAICKFHEKTKYMMSDNPIYFSDRLYKDLDLVETVVQSEPTIARVYQKMHDIAKQNNELIDSRTAISPVVEGHGDLNLDHIFLESNDFCFIDFSHKKKYRIDDPSRDLAGVVLHLMELGCDAFVQPFVAFYISQCSDDNLALMIKLQLGKKFLVKYFIYYGGFAPEHREEDQLELCRNTVDTVLKYLAE